MFSWLKENPGAAFIQFIQHIVLIPLCVFIIAGFCNLKLFVFKKVPVISERLEARQERFSILNQKFCYNLWSAKLLKQIRVGELGLQSQ
jgi:Na+/H+ antiporter NhaD/arsenite permease-like protein